MPSASRDLAYCHLILCTLVFSSLAATPASAESTAAPPNVVLIMTDDQGFGDVGLHGNPSIRTPHLDRFAREGIEITRFYCSPVCAPTRASLLTGRYYYRTGVIHTSRGGAKMHSDELTVAELLAEAGYATAIFGKWHLGDNYPMRPTDQGFQEALVHKSGGIGQTPDKPNSYFDPRLWRNNDPIRTEGYCTDVFTNAAIQFLRKHRDGPSFVYLATNTPHTPLEIDEKYVAPYRDQGLDETTARIYGTVQNLDENVGRLLDALDQLQIRDNTFVVFLTDNGPQQRRYNGGLKGRKSSVYEGGIRVPCFLQWPAKLTGGRSVRQLAAHIDILPTLLDACQVPVPETLRLDGMSLLPHLRGELRPRERTLFFQCHRGLKPQRYHNAAVVTQRYKLVLNPDTFSQELLPPSQRHLELYDLILDEAEQSDLADISPEVASKLRNAYDAWFDDVRMTRDFTPGSIVLGTNREDPMRLCRYQDGSYVDGYSRGWPVQIMRGGTYRLRVVGPAQTGRRSLYIAWQGQITTQPMQGNCATAEIAAGEGLLDIWFQDGGQQRVRIGDNSPTGDVIIERLFSD
jgi:arylsulfatase A-like enzyme